MKTLFLPTWTMFSAGCPQHKADEEEEEGELQRKPYSSILGEGACHVEMGVSIPPVPPPFIFLISACSAYSVCLQALNKATNKIQFISKPHIQKSSLRICYVPSTRNRKWTQSAFTELQDRTSLGDLKCAHTLTLCQTLPFQEDASFLKQGKRPWGADGSFQN